MPLNRQQIEIDKVKCGGCTNSARRAAFARLHACGDSKPGSVSDLRAAEPFVSDAFGRLG